MDEVTKIIMKQSLLDRKIATETKRDYVVQNIEHYEKELRDAIKEKEDLEKDLMVINKYFEEND